jgi:ribose-phosphate pyrophosphokinase
MKLISGQSNRPLATSIANQLNISMVDVDIENFSNGEKRIWIKDDVQGENIILVQSFSQPVDEHIMELLLMTDALERLGARHVNAVIPWFGYSLQDKAFRPGEPLSAKVVANLVSNAYVKRTFLLDTHNTSIVGFFSVPTHHSIALPLFIDYAKNTFNLENTVVASPDFGGLKRAFTFAEKLGVDWVNIDKRRNPKTNEIVDMELHGDVRGKTVLVYDDVIVSGGTVVEAAEVIKNAGAAQVFFLVTHGLFTGDAFTKLMNDAIDGIVVTNSIHHETVPSKVTVLDCASIFADQIRGWM